MPRPRRAVRPVEKSLSLPEDLAARVELMLWSELEERVPHGAFSAYVERLIREDFATRDRAALAKQGA